MSGLPDSRSGPIAEPRYAHKMLTGQTPFAGMTHHEVLAKLLDWEPPSVDPLPASLAGIVAKLMAADRDERFQSAEEVLAGLPDVLGGEGELVALSQARGNLKSESWRWAAAVRRSGAGIRNPGFRTRRHVRY